MAAFRLAPEEVFADIIAALDRIKEEPDEAATLCGGLWDEWYCEYRDAAETAVPEAELARAVGITMLGLVVCLDFSTSFYNYRLVKMLLRSVSEHCEQGCDDFRHIIAEIGNLAELGQWLNAYMESDEFLTGEDCRLNLETEKADLIGTLGIMAKISGANPIISIENYNNNQSRQVYTQGGAALMDGKFDGNTNFISNQSTETKPIEQNER